MPATDIGMSRRAVGVLDLARPLNALATGAAVLLALVVAGGAEALRPAWGSALLFATGVLFAAGSNAWNDAHDADVDRRAHPRRPVPSGRLSARAAGVAAAAFFALAVAATALAAPRALPVVLLALALEAAYELRLKALGLPGNLAVAALTAAPFLLGGVAAGRLGPDLLAFAALAALATLGRELLKDLEDAPHDVGRRTFAQREPRAATRAAQGALALAVLLSPLPALFTGTVLGRSYLAVVAMADALFLAAILQSGRSPPRAQRVAKAAMLVALAALLVGSVWP